MTDTDPFSPEMKACPYPGYEAWREQGPLTWSPEIRAWLVTSYSAARSVLADDERFSSGNSVFGGARHRHPEFPSMINQDEPEHRRLRSLVSRAFTPRTIEQAWEPRIREVIGTLLDAVQARGNGRMEVVQDFAYPLPVQIISEIIGVPPEKHADFKQWSTIIVNATGRVSDADYQVLAAEEDPRPRPQPSPDEARAFAQEYQRLVEAGQAEPSLAMYFYAQIFDRRDHPRDDLITRLVDAEVEGHRLTDDELISFLVLLLVAGNETTTNLICHALMALADDGELQARVRADRSLIGPLLEEALRWESPIQGFYRRATVDATVEGVLVRDGDALLVLYGAANHDPARFECPQEFRLDRFAGDSGTRDHLAFGAGIHHCLGAELARLEASLAVGAVLDRWSVIERITPADEVEWTDAPFFRGPRGFEVRLLP